MKKALSLILAAMMLAAMAGCGQNNSKELTAETIKVVSEAGSTGEEKVTGKMDDANDPTVQVIAKDYFAKSQYSAVESMATALMDVENGVADVAVVDSVIAQGMIESEDSSYKDLVINMDNKFGDQYFGIAFRKGSDICPMVNDTIKTLKENGKLKEIADKYGLADGIAAAEAAAGTELETVAAAESDWEYVKNKGVLVVGVTNYPPMNFLAEDKTTWTGFDTEFAQAVCAELGVDVKFIEISWEAKETELASKNIDCLWNGMCITDERKEAWEVSTPYMYNTQAMVMKADKADAILAALSK